MSSCNEEVEEILAKVPHDVPEWGRALIGLIKCMMTQFESVKEVMISKLEIKSNAINKLGEENRRLNDKIQRLENHKSDSKRGK